MAALREDVGPGDYSTLASIPADARGKAVLKIKEGGIIAGLQLAEEIFKCLEPGVTFTFYKRDGELVDHGEIAFEVAARVHTILKAERLVLNCMQRMSGIATLTRKYVDAVKGYPAKILDTRKTTPLFRQFEKQAVHIGGGVNHRMGLYDMIMLKDNHIDFSGGIEPAIRRTNEYLKNNALNLKIEIETRNLNDVKQVLQTGIVHRIMLDNFTPAMMAEAVSIAAGRVPLEISGNVDLQTIGGYARTGVDFISVGALTKHVRAIDLSLRLQLSS